MTDLIGPDRPRHPNTVPNEYRHHFDDNDNCLNCGAHSYTQGALCTASKGAAERLVDLDNVPA